MSIVDGWSPQCECPRVLLSDVCEHICSEVGLAADMYDFSRLTQCILGYTRPGRMTGRSALEPLSTAHGFDLVEVDGAITAIPRDGTADTGLILDWESIGALIGNADAEPEIVVVRAQDTEIPCEVRVSFSDVNLDYQPGLARQINPVPFSDNIVALEAAMVFEAGEAKQIAARLLRESIYDRVSCEAAVKPEYLQLVPTDILTIRSGGADYRMRIIRIGLDGPGVAKLTGVLDHAAAYDVDDVQSDVPLAVQTLVSAPMAMSALPLDIPLLRDSDNDAGFYAFAWGVRDYWGGGALYQSLDGGGSWGRAAEWGGGQHAIVGRISVPVGSTEHPWSWDDANTITVDLLNDSWVLESATDLQVLNGANAAAIGAPGRWEIIQFANAEQDSGAGWTLSRLLRGRKGTEWAIGQSEGCDWFVLLNRSGIRRIGGNLDQVGRELDYQAASFGMALDTLDDWQFASDAVGLKPYAPVDIQGSRTSGDLVITWKRRTRIGGEWSDYADVPLGEAYEAYDVEMYDGATLLRTITTSAATATYTAAEYAADTGDSGSEVGEVDVKIYQLSDAVGRGYPGEATL